MQFYLDYLEKELLELSDKIVRHTPIGMRITDERDTMATLVGIQRAMLCEYNHCQEHMKAMKWLLLQSVKQKLQQQSVHTCASGVELDHVLSPTS